MPRKLSKRFDTTNFVADDDIFQNNFFVNGIGEIF